MRIVIASVLAAAFAAGGATLAQVSMAQGVSGAPMVSRAYTVEPFTPATPITIQGDGVRLRAEPFTSRETQVLSSGSTGLALTVVGISRQPDWNWYQVILRNGQKAFIRSDLTSAPSRGGATAPVATAPVQPVQPPVVYTPPQTPQPVQPALPVQPSPPQTQPQPVQPQPVQPVQPQPIQPAQPLPTIPTQPLNNSGVISLTPGGPAPAIPGAATAPAPVDNGLLSVSPTPPAPRFATPAQPAPVTSTVASTPAPAITAPASAASTGSVAQQIRAQLDSNRCWTDSSSMMDAHRLRATFAVAFAPNGKFAGEPRLIEPAAEPTNDPAMMVFLAKARAAMRTCNALGFAVPPAYYSGGAGEVRLDFSAR